MPSIRSTAYQIDQSSDFDLDTVFTNDPLNSFYNPEKRNPFIPHQDPKWVRPDSKPLIRKKISQLFKWIKDIAKPIVAHIENYAPKVRNDIPPKPDQSYVKVDNRIVKKDKSIPVYLIGFAKTEPGKERKVLLFDKKTGTVYTVVRGNSILDLTILDITPYSVLMELKNGKRIEYFKDILKENGV
jgi:hypothetical protein